MNWASYDFKRQKAGALGEVLTHRIYPCGLCRGTGLAPSDRHRACPVCLGRGKVKVGPRALVCAYCRGAGKSILNPTLTCGVCRGKGVVPVSGPIRVCEVCRGRGRTQNSRLPCLTCRGLGVKMQATEKRMEGAA